ncbi:MAG: hypothetical protein V2A73_03145 [Pseudomonadota bacterium]
MMRAAFPKVYQSFEEFEREELDRLNSLSSSIDEMFDGWFVDEMEYIRRQEEGRYEDDA